VKTTLFRRVEKFVRLDPQKTRLFAKQRRRKSEQPENAGNPFPYDDSFAIIAPMSYRRIFRFFSFALLLLALAGCEKSPRLRMLPPDAVVLAFGDSLTYGTGAVREESYPAVLAARLQRPVVNAGIPGEVSAEGLSRLPALLAEHRPALVLLCHGGNDFLRRGDPEEVRGNLRRMIELAQSSGAQVVLVGVPQPGIFLAAAPLYREVAAEFGLPYEGEALAEILADRSLKSDTIHPNAAGYRQLAETLAELIARAQK
jgi:acyl-CoA thioesterase-1